MGVDKKVVFELLKENINLGGLVAGALDEVLEPALKKVVADSSNSMDDILMAAVYPVLEKELKEKVEEWVNKLWELGEDKPEDPAPAE